MRRITTLCAIAGIIASTAAIARPAPQSGYYVIRWDNTGVCQIWNTELQQQPVHFLSDYQVVSKPVPTFAAAVEAQDKLRSARRCTL
jgi:hypothetical protein